MRIAILLLSLLAIGSAQMLPTGREIRPVGKRFELDTFPMRAVRVPGQRKALVLQSGFRPTTLALIDLDSGATLTQASLPDAGVDFGFDSTTGRAYVPGGNSAKVFVFNLRDEQLEAAGVFSVAAAADSDNASLPAEVSGVSVSPNGKVLAALEAKIDRVTLLDANTGAVIRRIAGVGRPAHAVFAPDSKRLYVASAQESAVVVLDAVTGRRLTAAPVSAGPAHLLLHKERLYVACANSNYLDVLHVGPAGALTPRNRLNLSFTPSYPNGLSPTSLSLDGESDSLLVVLSDANAVARIRLDAIGGKSAPVLVPTGWYPTFALPLEKGGMLILNAKGFGSKPNPHGPNPTIHKTMTPQPPSPIEYTPLIQSGGGQLIGTMSAAEQKAATQTVLALNHAIPRETETKLEPGHPIPLGGGSSPIKHVIYIMKENRTYDQVLGDLKIGNGDASLCLFPERITPNHHKLAREFTLFDNFYVNADVSSEGWQWTSAAIVPHFVMRAWPAAYAGRTRLLKDGVPTTRGSSSEAKQDAFTVAPSGYIWTRALDRGLRVRNFGYFVKNRPDAKPGEEQMASVSDPGLLPYTNRYYAGYNPDFPDVERARIFLEELASWEKSGSMPELVVMILPNDHTWGTSPGKLTPFSSMADNDLALGRVVEAVSKSRFWKETAIFVVEDDAQNGPDHVDSHRSIAYVISPYTKRGFVDSTFYNTTSLLRTMELILGLNPLTHYDAFATPILDAFQSKADTRAYEALDANVPLTLKNPEGTATAARSQQLNLEVADAIDEREMNDILWIAIKGTPAPAPVDSVFLEKATETNEEER